MFPPKMVLLADRSAKGQAPPSPGLSGKYQKEPIYNHQKVVLFWKKLAVGPLRWELIGGTGRGGGDCPTDENTFFCDFRYVCVVYLPFRLPLVP